MEHGDKMEHRVFMKRCAMCAFVLLLCLRDFRHWPVWFDRTRSNLKRIPLKIPRKNAITPYSIILMYKFGHGLGRLLWQSKLQNHREFLFRIIYLF